MHSHKRWFVYTDPYLWVIFWVCILGMFLLALVSSPPANARVHLVHQFPCRTQHPSGYNHARSYYHQRTN